MKRLIAALLACTSLALPASERIEIRNGRLDGQGAARAVRLHATGTFDQARVRVNGIAAGELATSAAELDITGYLSQAGPNMISVEPVAGEVTALWAWLSPLIYLERAVLANGMLKVVVVNSTENTSQIDIGEHRFAVAAGTSVERRLPWPPGKLRITMHAVTDGLDREFTDEIDAATVDRR